MLLSATSRNKSTEPPGALPPGSCTSQTGLHCEIYGSGDPIVFLHGLGASTYSWRYMIAPLSVEHQVILIDFRGAGQSPKPHDKDYSILKQCELVYRFIVEHDLRQLTLVGNSYGGAVSLLLAVKFSELAAKFSEEKQSRLSKLILIDSAGYPDHLPLFVKILRTPILGWLVVHLVPPKLQTRIVLGQSYYNPRKITKDQVAAYAKPLASRGGRHALLQIARQAIPKNIDELIAKYPTIRVPTLILWGETDRILPRLIGERLKAAIAESTLEVIPRAGHVPQEEQPDDVVRHLKAFLNS
jgi:pimeloyl-ACP methyl ester carboxylesterase